MTTQEIFSAIKRKESNQKPQLYAVYEALVYLLWLGGYQRRHIADALGVHPDSISYTIQTSRAHLSVADKLVQQAKQDLREHKLEIRPYFEHNERGIVKLRTTLYIDNHKYQRV